MNNYDKFVGGITCKQNEIVIDSPLLSHSDFELWNWINGGWIKLKEEANEQLSSEIVGNE